MSFLFAFLSFRKKFLEIQNLFRICYSKRAIDVRVIEVLLSLALQMNLSLF